MLQFAISQWRLQQAIIFDLNFSENRSTLKYSSKNAKFRSTNNEKPFNINLDAKRRSEKFNYGYDQVSIHKYKQSQYNVRKHN